MSAKLIARGDDREEAINELAAILNGVEVWPVKTNAEFLGRLLRMDEFKAAQPDTGLIGRKGESLTRSTVPDDVILAAVSWRLEEFMGAAAEGNIAVSPAGLFGFRSNADRAAAALKLTIDGVRHEVAVRANRADAEWQWDIAIDGRTDFHAVESLP